MLLNVVVTGRAQQIAVYSANVPVSPKSVESFSSGGEHKFRGKCPSSFSEWAADEQSIVGGQISQLYLSLLENRCSDNCFVGSARTIYSSRLWGNGGSGAKAALASSFAGEFQQTSPSYLLVINNRQTRLFAWRTRGQITLEKAAQLLQPTPGQLFKIGMLEQKLK